MPTLTCLKSLYLSARRSPTRDTRESSNAVRSSSAYADTISFSLIFPNISMFIAFLFFFFFFFPFSILAASSSRSFLAQSFWLFRQEVFITDTGIRFTGSFRCQLHSSPLTLLLVIAASTVGVCVCECVSARARVLVPFRSDDELKLQHDIVP
ncbi:hypothetical protein F4810DRAFT_507412 [Camillea tinctor]|nr:hypothetical protein F4810DRAFT_507412 [Camillea tinctor]